MSRESLTPLTILGHKSVDVDRFLDCDLVPVLEWFRICIVKSVKLKAKDLWYSVNPVSLSYLSRVAAAIGLLIIFYISSALVLPSLVKLFKANDPDHHSCE